MQARLPHSREHPGKTFVATKLTKRKSYLRCLLQLQRLHDAGLKELWPSEHEMYYRCVLQGKGAQEIPRGQLVRHYTEWLVRLGGDPNSADIAVLQQEEEEEAANEHEGPGELGEAAATPFEDFSH